MKYVLEFVKIPLINKSEYKSLLSACGGFVLATNCTNFHKLGH